MSKKMIVRVIRRTLEENGYPYFFRREGTVFSVNPDRSGPMGSSQVLVYVNDTSYVTRCMSPLSADSKDEWCMREMGCFLHLINYGMHQGAFEMNVGTGELGYRVYTDCENTLPSKAVILNSIRCPAEMLRRYGEGIGRIVYGGFDATAAFRLCMADNTEGTRDGEERAPSADPMIRDEGDVDEVEPNSGAPSESDLCPKSGDEQENHDLPESDMLSFNWEDELRMFGLPDDFDWEEPDI